jgi:Xaa-Pro aminopeptidase
MQRDNIDRLTRYFRGLGIDAALLAGPWTLTWLTGYAAPVQTGPSPFEAGPPLGWWRGSELTFLCSDADAPGLRAAGAAVTEYAGYTYETPLDVVERQAAALRQLLAADRDFAGRVAFEARFVSAAALTVARELLPRATFTPLNGELAKLRAVKNAAEIDRLRAVLALCDRGQALTAALIRPGLSEIELWGQLKAGLEIAAGARLPVQGDLVGGPRTLEMGGWAGDYVLREGDPLLADLVPRLAGYWGDICGTHFAGDAPPALARIYAAVRDALWRGMDAVRPGLRARALDALLRDAIDRAGLPPYPHHSGHGIGVCAHEEPRIVPYNDALLEPGMVIALEPAAYVPGIGGVRLENVVLVTADGCELLTRHLVA